MNEFNLNDFVRGWFVGGFDPSIIKTTEVEVAVQSFEKGSFEAEHCHKVATEITVIVEGAAKMFGKVYTAGSIIEIKPGEYTSFEALEDTKTVVVKYPGALNDKYLKDCDK